LDVETYSKYIHFWTDDTTDFLRDFLSSTHWETFLDLGCGDGGTLYALNERGFFQGKQVIAVDLSENRIALASQINPAFQCYVDDACHLQHVGPESIDVVVSHMVIEHVEDDETMVRSIHRILKPGGSAYIVTVFKKWYGWYFYRANGKWVIDPTHLREYTDPEGLPNMIRQNGFEITGTRMTQEKFPITDFIFRRFLVGREAYQKPLFQKLRRFRIPIPGYYRWEIICKKQAAP
jgi:2-polyprenyl-3-methyl-5-hydroxy-6-metoxy-1,4-benzoquinol methylase